MKKFLTMGVLALTALASSRQQASAWVNCKFGIGLNFQCQSGGNNFLWGMFRNGQPGGGDWECHRNCGYNYGNQGGYDGGYHGMMFNAAPYSAPAPTFTPPAPTPVSSSPFWFGNSDYQNANYAPDFDYGFSY